MQQLLEADKYLFRLINSSWNSAFLDATLPLIRNQHLWTPFYLFMLLFILINFKKTGWWWLIMAACVATLTNFVSSDIIKPSIFRVRPCNDPSLAEGFRFLVAYCPRSSSFTSSHAANHFGLAAFLYHTLKDHVGPKALLLFAWAGIIIYAQVYVGVHYPIDVIFGGLVGYLFGYLAARSYNRNYSLV